MKRKLAITAFLLVLGALAGCVVQSGGPYHTPEEKLDTPEALRGQWQLVDAPQMDDKDQQLLARVPPWEFGESEVTSYDKHGIASQLEVSFFKVGKLLYCDSEPASPEENEKPNEYWTFHVLPTHLLSRVEQQGDRVTFTLLDDSWLATQIKQGKIALPHLTVENDFEFYTASPEEWRAFLTRYGNDPQAFPADRALVFRRVAVSPAK
jgi:hypothetical protein